MKRRRPPRNLLRRIAAAVLAVVVLLAVVRGGARYFYCPMMHAVIDAPCCDGDGPRDPTELDELDELRDPLGTLASSEARSRDCCEERVLAKLPSTGLTTTPEPFDAPQQTSIIAPITALSQRVAAVRPSRFEHDDRAGPASTARHRAELMVFLS